MSRRKQKRAITILLAIFFVVPFAIFFGMPIPFHMGAGGIAAVLSIIHVCTSRKWLVSVRKARKTGKLTKDAKWRYRVDLLLIIVWGVCIFSGVLIGFPGILFTLAGMEDLFLFFVTHLFFAVLSFMLGIVHAIQHVRLG